MVLYAQAEPVDLSMFFLIMPLSSFVTPIWGITSDRYQIHKRLYLSCLICTVLVYTPFVAIPFLMKLSPNFDELMGPRTRLWLLSSLHLVGCLCFRGDKLIPDMLTINYTKRIGSDYARFRAIGPIALGTCSVVIGYYNRNWLLPDYTLGMLGWVLCHAILGLLVYAWPDEFFEILSESQLEESKVKGQLKPLPTGMETFNHVLLKLTPCRHVFQSKTMSKEQPELSVSTTQHSKSIKYLTIGQQVRIIFLLIRRDVRIPLYLTLMFIVGSLGHSMHHFIYVYLGKVCLQESDCDSSALSGYILCSVSVLQTLALLLASRFAKHLHHLAIIELVLVTSVLHYSLLGLFAHKSPYFFLTESMYGVEYGLTQLVDVTLGYHFGSKVSLLIPELTSNSIISRDDDLELVKKSLLTTTISCFGLACDGAGSAFGVYVYGLLINRDGYSMAFCLNAMLSAVVFVSVLLVYSIKSSPWLRKPKNQSPTCTCESTAIECSSSDNGASAKTNLPRH